MNSVSSYHFTLRLPNPAGDIHILGSVVRYKSIRTQSSSFIFYVPFTHQLQEIKKKNILSFAIFRNSTLFKFSQESKVWAITQLALQ